MEYRYKRLSLAEHDTGGGGKPLLIITIRMN